MGPAPRRDVRQRASLGDRLAHSDPFVRSTDVEAALASIGVAPDFRTSAAADAEILFVHRKLPDGDVYFVDNTLPGPIDTSGSFVTPANTASLRVRLHNYQNAAGSISFRYAQLTLTTPAATAPDAVIAGRDGWRGGATVTTAETLTREY